MNQTDLVDLLQQTVWIILLLGAPILITSMVVGLGISIFQAVTQIQESTLTFVPKIVVALIVVVFTGPWMVDLMVDHTEQLFTSLTEYTK
mgnify:CR=1 FL=1